MSPLLNEFNKKINHSSQQIREDSQRPSEPVRSHADPHVAGTGSRCGIREHRGIRRVVVRDVRHQIGRPEHAGSRVHPITSDV